MTMYLLRTSIDGSDYVSEVVDEATAIDKLAKISHESTVNDVPVRTRVYALLGNLSGPVRLFAKYAGRETAMVNDMGFEYFRYAESPLPAEF